MPGLIAGGCVGQMQAVLCGYYGKGNGGDEALLASLLQMLPDNVTPLVLSGNPAETRDRYQVAAWERMSVTPVLKSLRESDVLIWGGGSLIQDATSRISPLYYTGLMILARRMGLKTIAWAQGVGPLNYRFTRWTARQAFAGCRAVSVRDRGSASILERWRIPSIVAPDPVWALESVPVQGLEVPSPRVAVALRSHPLLTPAYITNLTRALVDFQKVTQTSIVLIPFQPVQDLAIAQTIQPQLSGPSQILSLQNPQELKGAFQGVEMAIAMRYHGLIMAAAEGCRCFALSYDPKVSQLMDDLNLPGWDLAGKRHAPLPDDPIAISRAWIDHYTSGQPLSSTQLQAMVDQALRHRELLHEALR